MTPAENRRKIAEFDKRNPSTKKELRLRRVTSKLHFAHRAIDDGCRKFGVKPEDIVAGYATVGLLNDGLMTKADLGGNE